VSVVLSISILQAFMWVEQLALSLGNHIKVLKFSLLLEEEEEEESNGIHKSIHWGLLSSIIRDAGKGTPRAWPGGPAKEPSGLSMSM
jgi:hypothetical protein